MGELAGRYLNRTPLTPAIAPQQVSEALAVIVTAAPETGSPGAGAVMATVGGSGGVGSFGFTDEETFAGKGSRLMRSCITELACGGMNPEW